MAERGVACAAAALAVGLWLMPAPAQADAPRWEAGLGVAGLRLPHYRGSDQSHAWLLPLPYFVYRGDILRADRDGARAVLFDSARIDADISVAAAAPTRSQDNRARAGMPDLAPMLEGGPSLKLRLAREGDTRLELRVPLRAAVTLESKPRFVGWTLSPHLNIDWRIGGWELGALAGPVLASRRFNATFYDVAPAYATAARPAYRAGGGAAGWQAAAGASRRVGDLWIGGFVKADSVAGAGFAESPLVRRRGTMAYGVGVSWVFASSSQRVADDH